MNVRRPNEAQRSRRRFAARIALAGAGVLVGLLAVEVLSRVLLPPSPHVIRLGSVEGGALPRAGGVPDTAVRLVPDHPERGFVYLESPTGRRLRPGAHVVIERHALSRRRIEIRINSLGYRNREIGEKAGTRILFLGDSVTFGDYLPEEETFVRLVETLAREDGRAWETINAGVGAIGLKDEIAILLETGIAVRPDAVVVGFYLNDFQDSPGYFPAELPALVAPSRLLTHLWTVARRSSLERLPPEAERWAAEFRDELAAREGRLDPEHRLFLATALENFRDWGGSFSVRAWERMQPLLEELKRLAQRHRFRLFVVAFPVRDQVATRGVYAFPQEQLAWRMRELDVPVLDTLPALRRAARSGSGSLYYDHCHHTPEGARLAAQEIYRFLAQRLDASGPLPP